jgi:hypothetical protein
MKNESYYRYRYHINSESESEAIAFCFIAFMEVHQLLSYNWGDNNNESRNNFIIELALEVAMTPSFSDYPRKLVKFALTKEILNKSWRHFEESSQNYYFELMSDHFEAAFGGFNK